MTFADALAHANRRYDNALPEDDRSDEQIEQDAADRIERDRIAILKNATRSDALWDLLVITRGMK